MIMNIKKIVTNIVLGIIIILTTIFITLKCCGAINWLWIWVLSPLWLPIALGALIVVGIIGVAIWVYWKT